MLRITIQQRDAEVQLVLEGRLEGPLVPELERTFAEQRDQAGGRPVIVDLFGLTGMDEAGKSSLQKLYQRGATLRRGDVMNEYLVDRMTRGAMEPLQAPCRPDHATETQEIQRIEEE